MKGFIRKSVVVAGILCVFLSGCGNSMVPLTEEEEQIVVAYASGAVAKANKHQQQGLVHQTEVPKEQDAPLEEEEAQGEESAGEPAADTVTFTDALKIPGLTADYHGYQLMDNYKEGDYFALYAEAGNTYLVVQVGLTNTTQQPLECDLFGKNLQCSLMVNGVEAGDAMTTILLNDFISYIKTLEAGASEETIMIFEIPKEQAETIETIALNLTVDGASCQINLD